MSQNKEQQTFEAILQHQAEQDLEGVAEICRILNNVLEETEAFEKNVSIENIERIIIAHTYFMKGHYHEALRVLEYNMVLIESTNQCLLLGNAYNLKAHILIKLNEPRYAADAVITAFLYYSKEDGKRAHDELIHFLKQFIIQKLPIQESVDRLLKLAGEHHVLRSRIFTEVALHHAQQGNVSEANLTFENAVKELGSDNKTIFAIYYQLACAYKKANSFSEAKATCNTLLHRLNTATDLKEVPGVMVEAKVKKILAECDQELELQSTPQTHSHQGPK